MLMIRIFMLYENFHYLVFTRHLACKIWSPICLYSRYCIALSDSSDTINLTRFLYQICLTGKSDENDYLYVQNTEVH